MNTSILLSRRVASLTLIVLASVLCAASSAQAAVITPFTQRFNQTTNGDVLFVSNVNLSCQTSDVDCAAARNGTGTRLNNNDFAMGYVNADPAVGVYNSSSSSLTLPTDATVLYAALYWAGDTNGSTPAPSGTTNTVELKVPGTLGYNTVTSDQTTTSGSRFTSFLNVTSTVQAAGAGSYSVANIAGGSGNSDTFDGWTLVVVIKDPAAPARNLSVFDGLARVQSGETVSVGVSGFQTPPTGAVNANIGVVSFEGDLGFTGDTATLTSGANTTSLTNAVNPSDNYANATFSRFGSLLTGNRNPEYTNNLGFDADVFRNTNALPNSATSAQLNFTSTSETYFPLVATFAIDAYYPNLSVGAAKRVTDVNGGRVEPGDQLEYAVQFNNSGEDVADNTIISDNLPPDTVYVPGSLSVTSGANLGAKTDAGGDDQAEYNAVARRVVARVGTGATSAAGGSLNIGESSEVTFRVTVSPNATDGELITNIAGATFTGRQTGLPGTAQTPSGAARVSVIFPSDLSTTINAPTSLTRGVPVAYSLAVANNGPNPTFGNIVEDYTVGSGARITSAGGNGFTCVIAADEASMRCTRFAVLATGATALIPVSVQARQSAPSSVTTPAVVSGGTDSSPANNTATASIPVNSVSDLVSHVSLSPSAVNGGNQVTATSYVANSGPSDAAGPVQIVLTVPSGFSLVSSSGGDFTCGAQVAQTITCTSPTTVASGAQSASVAFVLATGQTGGTRTVSSQVSSGSSDSNPNNNTATANVFVRVAPTATNDAVTSAEDTTVNVNVLANDTASPGGAPVTLVSTSSQSTRGGTVVQRPNGTIDYTPPANQTGTDTFTYTITDDNGLSSTATVTVTLTPVDDAPVAADDSAATDVDRAVDIAVLANDTDIDSSTLTVTNLSTPANGQVSVNLDGTVHYVPSAGYDGMDSFTYDATDSDGRTSTATVSLTVGPVADLQVTLTRHPAGDVPVGHTVVFTYAAKNNGPSAAHNATATITIPAGLSIVSVPPECVADAGDARRFVCQVGQTVASGAQRSGQFTLRAEPEAGGQTLSIGATARADEPDPTPNNQRLDVKVVPSAALSVDARFTAVPAPGQLGTYVMTVTNSGPSGASNVTLSDRLPDGFEIVSASPEAGSCTISGQSVSCAVGDVAANSTRTVTVMVRVPQSAASKTLNHQLLTVSATPEPDVNVDRRAGTPPFTVGPAQPVAAAPAGRPDIVVTQTVRESRFQAGDIVHFVVNVKNRGTATADDVSLASLLSLLRSGQTSRFGAQVIGAPDLEIVGVSTSRGTCTREDRQITCKLGDYTAGDDSDVIIAVRVLRAGKLAATSTATPTNADVQPGNNGDVLGATAGAGKATLAVVHADAPKVVRAGQRVLFTIRATVTSKTPALNVRICEKLPKGFVISSRRGARIESGRACWRIEAIRSGHSQTRTLVAVATRDARPGSRSAVATVSAVNAASVSRAARVQVLAARAADGGVTG